MAAAPSLLSRLGPPVNQEPVYEPISDRPPRTPNRTRKRGKRLHHNNTSSNQQHDTAAETEEEDAPTPSVSTTVTEPATPILSVKSRIELGSQASRWATPQAEPSGSQASRWSTPQPNPPRAPSPSKIQADPRTGSNAISVGSSTAAQSTNTAIPAAVPLRSSDSVASSSKAVDDSKALQQIDAILGRIKLANKNHQPAPSSSTGRTLPIVSQPTSSATISTPAERPHAALATVAPI